MLELLLSNVFLEIDMYQNMTHNKGHESSASRKYFPKFTEKWAEFTIKFTTEIKITIMVKNNFYCIFVNKYFAAIQKYE